VHLARLPRPRGHRLGGNDRRHLGQMIRDMMVRCPSTRASVGSHAPVPCNGSPYDRSLQIENLLCAPLWYFRVVSRSEFSTNLV
jgi:hypothetical protein